MVTYEIQGPDGNLYQIDGPEGASKSQIVAAIQAKLRSQESETRAPEERKPEPETGFFAGLRSAAENVQAARYAVEAAAGVEGAEQKAKERREKSKAIYKQPEFLEHPVDYVTGLAGQSIPYVVAPAVAGGAAMLAAPALGLGALGTTVAATGAAFLANAGQFSATNLSRQLEEGTKAKDLNVLNAVAASIPQAALDTLSLKMMPGLGNILGKAGFRLGEREIEEVAKQSIIKQVAKTSGTEGLTESAQAVLERAQAGLNITNEDARREYFENFIGGAVLGGTIGVPGHAYQKMKAQDQVMAKEYAAEQATIKAKEEAAKIEQTAVPDAQGKIELPTYLQAGAVGRPPEQQVTTPAPIAEQQVTTPAPVAEQQVTTPTPAALTKENVAAAYAANDVSTEKVRKELEPQLIEMGLDTKEEQKAYLKTVQAELGIPTVDPKASGIERTKQRRAKDQWKANYLTQQELGKGEENVQPPATINAAANKLGTVGSAPAMEGTPTGVNTSNVSGMVDTGGDATTDNVAEGTQLAALTPEEEHLEESLRLALEAQLAEEAELTKAESVGKKNKPVKPPPATKIVEPERRTIKLEEDKAAPVEQHTPEQTAFLQMKTKTRAKPAESIAEGIDYAVSETAFDLYDAAYPKVAENVKPLVEQENEARKKAYDEAVARGEEVDKPEKATTLDVLQKMPEAELIKLFDDNVDETRLNQERRKQAGVRGRFIKSLSKEQQKAIDKKTEELFHKEIRGAKNVGRTTTGADKRKSREERSKDKVEKLVTEAEKPARKVTPTKEKTGPTQIETLEQKRDANVRKALESGDIDEVFAAIANERVNDSITAMFARKIYDVFKTFDVSKTKSSIEKKLAEWAKTNNKDYEAARKSVAAAEKYRYTNPDEDVPEDLVKAEKAAKTVIKEYEAEREKLIDRLSGGKGARPNIVIGKVEDGHSGKYDPSTETITIDLDNLGKDRLDVVVLHELTHYMTDHIVDNRGNLTKEQQAAVNQLDRLQKYVNSQLGKKFDVGTLKEFIAQAFSNPEFQTAMGNLPPMETEGKKQNVFSLFAKRVMEMLGFRNRMLTREEREEAGGVYGSVLGDVLTQIEQIIKIERTAPAVGVSYMAKSTKPPIPAPAGGDTSFKALRDSVPSPNFSVSDTVKSFSKSKIAEGAVRIFQNDRAAIKNWQRRLWLTGRLVSYSTGFNNIYDQITLSSGNAHWMYSQYVQEHNEAVRKEIVKYAKERDLDIDTALKELGLFAIARHEDERREVLYLREVPLSISPILTDSNGDKVSPFAARNEIYAYLNKHKLDLSGAKYLRDQLNAIVNDKNNLSKEEKDQPYLDRNSQKYNVAGYSPDQIKAATAEYNKHKAAADKVLDKLKAVNDAVIELNEMANYMSAYAKNYIMFYGFNNYVPFKGKNFNEDKADIFNTDSRKLGGELQEDIHTFEGRATVPENPLLQLMADGAKASMRAGRKDVTQSIYNAVNDLTLDGRVVQVVNFEDRANEKLLEELKGNTKIFHYMPDGKVAVIQINDRAQREAIRRTYRDTNPLADWVVNKANLYTGRVGQMHTRYNLKFAAVNFVRDVLTNAWTIGAEGKGFLGPLQSFRYLGAVAFNVINGNMFKSWRFSALYSQGNTKVIEQLAKTDDYYKDLMDYVKTGGKVSYIQGIAAKGQMQELSKLPSGKILTKENIDRFFDVWIDTFEMASRVSAFRIAKSNEIAVLSKKGGKTKKEIENAATVTASAYAKNLANFEQVGEWGKVLGGLFMFFRPSATGAVRAMDAVAPAFRNKAQVKLSLPEFARAAIIKEKLSKGVTDTEEKKLKEELAVMEKALATFDENYGQIQTSSRIVMGALIGAGFITYLMAKAGSDNDELGRDRVSTDDMARWTKFARFHIPGLDTPFQMPWGYGLGAFSAIGAQLAAMTDSKNPTSTAEYLDNIRAIVMDSFLPLPISRISPIDKPLEFAIDSVFPSITRPPIEYAMNVDALGHQIYNNRQTRYGDAYTGGDNIPESFKFASRWLVKTTNGDLNISPNTLYFFFNNYLDGASNLVNSPISIGLWLSGKKDFNAHTDTMFLDSFFGTRSNFDARQWSKIEEDLKKRDATIKMFKASDPEQYDKYIAKHPLNEMLAEMYNGDVNGHLKDLRAEANMYRTMQGLGIKTRTALVKNAVLQENFEKARLVNLYKVYGVKP